MVKSEFPKYKTEEGSFYEFELEQKGTELEVVMDMNGKVVKKEILKGRHFEDKN